MTLCGEHYSTSTVLQLTGFVRARQPFHILNNNNIHGSPIRTIAKEKHVRMSRLAYVIAVRFLLHIVAAAGHLLP
jgi:hypothetical protein